MFYIVVQILMKKICCLLLQFSEDIDVYMTKPDGTYKMMKITELLPHSFRPSRLLQQSQI